MESCNIAQRWSSKISIFFQKNNGTTFKRILSSAIIPIVNKAETYVIPVLMKTDSEGFIPILMPLTLLILKM